MKLIVGLGNPGELYAQHLHSVGFSVIDWLAEQWGSSKFQKKFQSLFAQVTVGDVPVLLLKPQTYMNLSGPSVVECSRFFKVDPAKILVISDDLELPPGKLRLRLDGGHGGHNGLRSIIQSLGSNQFRRLRIGIGRPPGKQSVSDYVLSQGSPITREKIETTYPVILERLTAFIAQDVFSNDSISIME